MFHVDPLQDGLLCRFLRNNATWHLPNADTPLTKNNDIKHLPSYRCRYTRHKRYIIPLCLALKSYLSFQTRGDPTFPLDSDFNLQGTNYMKESWKTIPCSQFFDLQDSSCEISITSFTKPHEVKLYTKYMQKFSCYSLMPLKQSEWNIISKNI